MRHLEVVVSVGSNAKIRLGLGSLGPASLELIRLAYTHLCALNLLQLLLAFLNSRLRRVDLLLEPVEVVAIIAAAAGAGSSA